MLAVVLGPLFYRIWKNLHMQMAAPARLWAMCADHYNSTKYKIAFKGCLKS